MHSVNNKMARCDTHHLTLHKNIETNELFCIACSNSVPVENIEIDIMSYDDDREYWAAQEDSVVLQKIKRKYAKKERMRVSYARKKAIATGMTYSKVYKIEEEELLETYNKEGLPGNREKDEKKMRQEIILAKKNVQSMAQKLPM